MRCVIVACLLAWNAAAAPFAFRTNDVVAFIGGADVVTAQKSGSLEAILTVHYRDLRLRFRNFGWEGDTVFAQPRDYGFPPLEKHLERAGATVVVLQFGRAEALEGHAALEFAAAYSNLLGRFTGRFLLVIPPGFEKPRSSHLPDLTKRNPLLQEYARAIRTLGHPTVDLSGVSGFTEDGLQITAKGHALIAAEFARQLGVRASPAENVRQAVVAKNQLWFHYWRPQNWAFLGGDRTSVPSSRDHRDPKTRWFPSEMEKFLPLIAMKEAEIQQLAHEHN